MIHKDVFPILVLFIRHKGLEVSNSTGISVDEDPLREYIHLWRELFDLQTIVTEIVEDGIESSKWEFTNEFGFTYRRAGRFFEDDEIVALFLKNLDHSGRELGLGEVLDVAIGE